MPLSARRVAGEGVGDRDVGLLFCFGTPGLLITTVGVERSLAAIMLYVIELRAAGGSRLSMRPFNGGVLSGPGPGRDADGSAGPYPAEPESPTTVCIVPLMPEFSSDELPMPA